MQTQHIYYETIPSVWKTVPQKEISLKKPFALANGFFLAGAEGLEPTTHGFGDQYSTN